MKSWTCAKVYVQAGLIDLAAQPQVAYRRCTMRLSALCDHLSLLLMNGLCHLGTIASNSVGHFGVIIAALVLSMLGQDAAPFS